MSDKFTLVRTTGIKVGEMKRLLAKGKVPDDAVLLLASDQEMNSIRKAGQAELFMVQFPEGVSAGDEIDLDESYDYLIPQKNEHLNIPVTRVILLS
jgi:hypothetical protein